MSWRGLVTALLVALPSSAAAEEQWKSNDGRAALEVRAFDKLYGAGLVLPSGLVEGERAFAELLASINAMRPGATGALGLRMLPDDGAFGANVARVWGRFDYDKLTISAAWQLTAIFTSDPALTPGTLFGGSFAGSGTSARRRLVDLDHQLARSDRFLLTHDLDLLAVKLSTSLGDLVVGRQVLSWGTGHFWNPTDLLSPFSPTDVDREVRHGIDAVRWSSPLSETSLVDLLFLPQKEVKDFGFVARAQVNVGGFDVSASAAKYVSDLVFGADTAGDLGPIAVHAEAAYTVALSEGDAPARVKETFLRAVVGAEWRPVSELVLDAEYHFNGFGASDPRDYVAKLASDRVQRGEVFGAGRHYLGLAAAWKVTDLVTAQTSIITNLADPSAIVVPVIEWWAIEQLIVRAGGYIPIGEGADPSVFRALTIADVTTLSPAFIDAIHTFGARSEYGLSAYGAFVELGAYF